MTSREPDKSKTERRFEHTHHSREQDGNSINSREHHKSETDRGFEYTHHSQEQDGNVMTSREPDKSETECRFERTHHSREGRRRWRYAGDYHESRLPPETDLIEHGDLPSSTDQPADRYSRRTR